LRATPFLGLDSFGPASCPASAGAGRDGVGAGPGWRQSAGVVAVPRARRGLCGHADPGAHELGGGGRPDRFPQEPAAVQVVGAACALARCIPLLHCNDMPSVSVFQRGPVCEEAISESLFDLVAPCDRAVAGTSLLACAAVYVAAGLLCLGRLKRGAPPWTGLLPGVPHWAWCLTHVVSRIWPHGTARLAHCCASPGIILLLTLQCAWMLASLRVGLRRSALAAGGRAGEGRWRGGGTGGQAARAAGPAGDLLRGLTLRGPHRLCSGHCENM